MDKRTLENLKYKVENALTEVADKQVLNNSDLELTTRLLCVLEQIRRVTDGIVGYSEEGNAYSGNSYMGNSNRSYGNSYNSYNSYNGASHNGNYSGHDLKGKMLQQLEQMKNTAHNEQEKNMINSWMRYVEQQ